MAESPRRALFEMEKFLGCHWVHLHKADKDADRATQDLAQLLDREVGKGLNFPPEDANLVAFGSLARNEWVGWTSDLDWTYLIDAKPNPHISIPLRPLNELSAPNSALLTMQARRRKITASANLVPLELLAT